MINSTRAHCIFLSHDGDLTMCDTMLAPPSHTIERSMLFAKNSDRQRNEAQAVEYWPGREHEPGAQLACTYITIPQARRTYSVLLCRPFWAWGAEMGANEHGVVIGNEAVHARSPACERNELPGMDLVRLGLERAASAAAAVDLMTALLCEYGAGGNCGHLTPAYFNNGFIVADAKEAFVLEMVEREWLVERVRHPRAISNSYSIGREVERFSAGLPALLQKHGWTSDPTPHYAEAIANPNREHIGHARARRARSTSLLQSCAEHITLASMIGVLRDHCTAVGLPDREWHPDQGGTLTLCMHACGADRYAQTAGSMVSEVYEAYAVHWVTATAAPCLSIFKPVVLGVPLPAHGPPPAASFDAHALWWRHELLHRAAVLGDFAGLLADIRDERDALEADFRARVHAVLRGGSVAERAQVIAQCWKEAQHMEDRWYSRIETAQSPRAGDFVAAWEEMNRLAGLEIRGAAVTTAN
jgi:secernin